MTPPHHVVLPPNLALLSEAVDIQLAYDASEACKLVKKLKVFELTLRVFSGNYADWQRVIDQYRPASPRAASEMMRRRRWVVPFLVELTRGLHNLVASAFTLVEHTRKLYNEIYKEAGLIPEYQGRVDAEFTMNGLASFIQGLRNYCLHYSLPLVRIELGVHWNEGTGATTTWGVPLTTSKLLAWSGWTAKPKEFLQAAGETIDLEAVVMQYRDKVDAFQGWFQEQQRSVHKAEFDLQAKTQFQIARLHELASFHGIIASLPLGQTHGFSEEELKPAAYEMYEEECRLNGCEVVGKDLEHWFRAIGRLKRLRAQEADFFPPSE